MTMQQLREAFAAWPQMEYYRYPRQVAAEKIMHLLTDPTPITEAGLRELGFEETLAGFYCNRLYVEWDHPYKGWYVRINGGNHKKAETIGRLRGLLLFVGDK